jgi:SNF2 family DNA or RNA helicase
MPKYQRLVELLSEIFDSDEKVLVFTSYQAMSDLFMRDIPRRWSDGFFRFIDGRIPVPERQTVVDDFYSHQGIGALFLNPKAAGTGLNIATANHVIHYNPEWNPALTAQASARAYRRKQDRPVTIHHLFFSDSVEDVMMDRAEFKRQLANGAVTGHEGNVDPSIMLRALQISPLSNIDGNKT